MQILSIELSYQRILTVLKSPYSSGLKLTALTKFLNTLFDFPEQNKLISYYTELSPEFNSLVQQTDFKCFSPENIKNLISVSNQFKTNGYASENSKEFEELQNLLDFAFENQNKNLHSSANDLNNSLSSNKVSIVLIENCDEESAEGVKQIGHIHNLHLSSSFRNKSESTDKIEFNNYVDVNDAKIVEHLFRVSDIAKNKYKGKHSFYNFTFYFDKTNFIYSGTSLGLGAICLTYNSLLINNLEKHYFKFNSDCVFSGEMDEEGSLQKLNSESL